MITNLSSDFYFPTAIWYLGCISRCTTDIRYIKGSGKLVHSSLSHLGLFASDNYPDLAHMRKYCKGKVRLPGNNLPAITIEPGAEGPPPS